MTLTSDAYRSESNHLKRLYLHLTRASQSRSPSLIRHREEAKETEAALSLNRRTANDIS